MSGLFNDRAARLQSLIESELLELADETFDAETAEDSDGLDQAKRDGILEALAVVRRVIREERRT